jgi:hypothetical protein
MPGSKIGSHRKSRLKKILVFERFIDFKEFEQANEIDVLYGPSKSSLPGSCSTDTSNCKPQLLLWGPSPTRAHRFCKSVWSFLDGYTDQKNFSKVGWGQCLWNNNREETCSHKRSRNKLWTPPPCCRQETKSPTMVILSWHVCLEQLSFWTFGRDELEIEIPNSSQQETGYNKTELLVGEALEAL